MNLKQILEKEDLKRLIYSFGTVEHRLFMREFCKTRGYISGHNQDHLTYVGNDLVSPIPRLYQGEAIVLDYLERFLCQCCSRHAHRKPSILLQENQLIYVDNEGERCPEDTNHFDCECCCRHIMRRLALHLHWMV